MWGACGRRLWGFTKCNRSCSGSCYPTSENPNLGHPYSCHVQSGRTTFTAELSTTLNVGSRLGYASRFRIDEELLELLLEPTLSLSDCR